MKRAGNDGYGVARVVAAVTVLLAVSALPACGGSTTPAASPSDAPSGSGDETSTTKPTSESATAPAADAPKHDDKVEEKAKEPASADELSAILQRVIEDEELDKYLKLTLPGRFPLKLSGSDLPSGITLTKGNQPVAILDSAPATKDAVLVLTTLEIDGNQATVAYRYDVEGIRGTARLKKGAQGWELKSSRIVEH